MTNDDEIIVKLLKFCRVLYVERAVYRVLAQEQPDWKLRFDQLIADPAFQQDVDETFSDVSKKLKDHQQTSKILQNLDRKKIH